ncbi:MAG: hypothetical protein ABIS06_15655 [Vicinamibacterales bacterium]
MRIAAGLFVFAILLVVFIALPGAGRVDTQPQTARSPFDALHFRDIGPAATAGRMHIVPTSRKRSSR